MSNGIGLFGMWYHHHHGNVCSRSLSKYQGTDVAVGLLSITAHFLLTGNLVSKYFMWVVLLLCSSHQLILHKDRRARRLRVLTGNQSLKCEPEIAGENMTSQEIAMISLVRPFTLNFTEPMVFFLNLYIALIYGLLYIWFESFPIVFEDIYGFSLELEGVAFCGILIGAAIAIPPFFWYLYRHVEPQFNSNGELRPEIRLQAVSTPEPICIDRAKFVIRHVSVGSLFPSAFSGLGGLRDPASVGLW